VKGVASFDFATTLQLQIQKAKNENSNNWKVTVQKHQLSYWCGLVYVREAEHTTDDGGVGDFPSVITNCPPTTPEVYLDMTVALTDSPTQPNHRHRRICHIMTCNIRGPFKKFVL